MSGRANGECSIYPCKSGRAAYVRVSTPAGRRDPKYVYGQEREEENDRRVEVQEKAAKTPVPAKTPAVAEFLEYWLAEVIRPNREEGTYARAS